MRCSLIAPAVAALGLSAAPALACVPPPRDTAAAMIEAQVAFIAEVTAVRQLPQADCERTLNEEGVRHGDPGFDACEAYGVAELRTIRRVQGEAEIPDAPLASWTARPFCYIGWQPQVGDRVMALMLDPSLRLYDGANVYVDPFDQTDSHIQALLQP